MSLLSVCVRTAVWSVDVLSFPFASKIKYGSTEISSSRTSAIGYNIGRFKTVTSPEYAISDEVVRRYRYYNVTSVCTILYYKRRHNITHLTT